jgi:hypothetical protein
MKLSRHLSEKVFEITTEEETLDWIKAVEKEVGGVVWVPIGSPGLSDNVHTVEVASDPALALVERPTNSVDAVLDLKACELAETSPTPHQAAHQWWGVPSEGLSGMSNEKRRDLADMIRVTMLESETADRPTIVIQDAGTGQHPDDFQHTLMSLLASNKKSSTHVMGVYNAGGAASYKFAKAAVVASRRAPSLLGGRADEIGVTVARYDPLDPDKFKSGLYVYMLAKDETVLRLDLPELPDLPYGTYIKLIEYQLAKYARAAHEPKQSLWHLFHAALPDPALPFRIIETRVDRFPGMKGTPTRRVVTGLLHLLRRSGTADYSDERTINLGEDGSVVLRYFVLNEGTDPDAYTTSEQGLTISLNGQRQITKDRYWVRRNLDLFYIFKRLVVLVDGTGLTNAAKRQVFSSTRETGVDSPLTKTILDRVLQEMLDDENLDALDEQAKQRTLQDATKTTTDKVKRQLASQIAAYLQGGLAGGKGGAPTTKTRKKRKRKKVVPQPVDDSMMLDVPDQLEILTDPVTIERGATASLRLAINAKNGFLPRHAAGLSVVFDPALQQHVQVRSQGRLVGGKVRVTLEADTDTPLIAAAMKVALVVQALGVLLTVEGKVEVVQPEEDKEKDKKTGGEPNIEVSWIGRENWEEMEPHWNDGTVGVCHVSREDAANATAITKVEWILNRHFAPYDKVVTEKQLSESGLKTFQEGYEYPVLFGLFKQRLAEEKKEQEADDEGNSFDVPDDYVEGEKARLARAVLMAMEPGIALNEAADE